MTHLWETSHAYYCSQENYYSRDCSFTFDSWAAFMEEWGDADMDYNLLFRWDWIDSTHPNTVGEYEQDELRLFYMQQRKGLFVSVTVKVSKDDEAMIREFLIPCFDHLKTVWAPL